MVVTVVAAPRVRDVRITLPIDVKYSYDDAEKGAGVGIWVCMT